MSYSKCDISTLCPPEKNNVNSFRFNLITSLPSIMPSSLRRILTTILKLQDPRLTPRSIVQIKGARLSLGDVSSKGYYEKVMGYWTWIELKGGKTWARAWQIEILFRFEETQLYCPFQSSNPELATRPFILLQKQNMLTLFPWTIK